MQKQLKLIKIDSMNSSSIEFVFQKPNYAKNCVSNDKFLLKQLNIPAKSQKYSRYKLKARVELVFIPLSCFIRLIKRVYHQQQQQ